jgi:uncharacterized 2Fe-2S/4Fe-4S cluster protein (DUF4445 family)
MAGNGGDQCEVRFTPDGVTATVARGSTILDACDAAGVAIDAVCGGEGKCGRCKVRPEGGFLPGCQDTLSRAEVDAGVVLACEATVDGDLEVEILPKSRIRKHQILERSAEREVPELSPWLWKTFVEMPKATVYDNTADLERLLRSMNDKEFTMPIETLRRLPHTLRKGDWKVTATTSRLEPPPEIVRLEVGDRRGHLLGLAVDIGTTTVVGQLVNLLTGEVIATASEYNRQISKGEDVIARMMFSEEEGVQELTALAQRTVNSVVADLLTDASERLAEELTAFDIVGASVAGNTIMTHFFLGLDTRYIRLEPYVPVTHHMPPRSGYDLGMDIHPSGRILLFPARAGYLGGDVVADILASGMHTTKDITLLIDVGTNGEIVLGCSEWLVSCACSAGPAFEGGEVSSGMRAMDGAIDRIRVNHDMDTSYHVIGDEAPNGICGSGLIDLIAEMYSSGIIDRKARIQELKTDRVRQGDEGPEYVVEWKDRLAEGANDDLIVTDADLQNILRTKAAIYGAATVLLKKMSDDFDDISEVVIAGGFGNHIDIDRAISIGMFPDIPREKYRFIGNGSLGGARLALLSEDMRREMTEIFDELTYIELSVDNDFYDEFTSSLFIPHTDIDKFPSFSEGTRRVNDA